MSIANEIISGEVCSICTQVFIDEKGDFAAHGCPVVCNECWERLSPEQRKLHIKAHYKTEFDPTDYDVDDANG